MKPDFDDIISWLAEHHPPWWLPLCFAIPSIILSVIVILMKLSII